MGKFTDLFRRSAKQQKSQSPSLAYKSYENDSGRDIAAMQVAGMQRNNQSTYITTYTATQPEPTLTAQSTTSTIDSNSSRTAVDPAFVSKHGESHWKGKPNGQHYDKREELSAEDEDAWARMAM